MRAGMIAPKLTLRPLSAIDWIAPRDAVQQKPSVDQLVGAGQAAAAMRHAIEFRDRGRLALSDAALLAKVSSPNCVLRKPTPDGG
jgi:hypothetical protein